MSAQALRGLAGETLCVGLAGPELGEDESERLRDLQPAAVILFARNLESPAQVFALTAMLRETLDQPLLLIDQEGGRVDRLKSLLGPAPSARMQRRGGAKAVRRAAELNARAVRALGFNFNCSPVVDLDEGHEDNGIGDRSFGSDPADVIAFARELLEAHAERGVMTSLKHFPGLGRTRADTHEVRPLVPAKRDELLARELVPFRELAPLAPAVMIGHVAFPELAGGDVPASLSPAICQELLRNELGYTGLAVTDDLEMGGVSDRPASERAVGALSAGCDLLLFCHRLDEATEGRDALAAAAAADVVCRDRLGEAAMRVREARERFASSPPAEVDLAELETIRQETKALVAELERIVS